MEPLIPGYYYHIYNHANGNDQLFREDKNYIYFLEKMREHIFPVADFYAYCLMPNHFHFLVKLKDEAEIQILESFPKFDAVEKVEQIAGSFISKQFSNFFSAYTQAYNRLYSRKGSLFLKNFKRKKITDESYFLRLVNYIHFNPVEHGFVNRPAEWKYSSFNAIISQKETVIKEKRNIGMVRRIGQFYALSFETIGYLTIIEIRNFGNGIANVIYPFLKKFFTELFQSLELWKRHKIS